jgi:hypothetical protein
MTLDEWLDIYDRHIPDHIAQMQMVYDEWLAARRALIVGRQTLAIGRASS